MDGCVGIAEKLRGGTHGDTPLREAGQPRARGTGGAVGHFGFLRFLLFFFPLLLSLLGSLETGGEGGAGGGALLEKEIEGRNCLISRSACSAPVAP